MVKEGKILSTDSILQGQQLLVVVGTWEEWKGLGGEAGGEAGR